MALADRITYTGHDVVEEAKRRIKRCLALFDHMWVSFSGGKDSLVVLHLVREVLDENGMGNVPVNVIFRDEELIPDDVISLVLSYCEDPRFNVRYYAAPMKSHMLILAEHRPYTQWDPDREWVRPKPEIAITELHPDGLPLDQHEMSGLTFRGVKGKIALLNGIRADESLLRLQSVLRSRGPDCWIAGEQYKAVKFCKPIFDWTEVDIFKYLSEREVRYATIYDKEMWCGAPLRVSTPLHDRAYAYLSRMCEMYPVFYEQMVSIWPDIEAHVRYYASLDRTQIIGNYPKSFAGINQYLADHIHDPDDLAAARKELMRVREAKENNKRTGNMADVCGYGYPLLRVFRAFVAGSYLKGIQAWADPGKDDIAYEQESEHGAQ